VASVKKSAATRLASNFEYGPPEISERYISYPATAEVLAVQESVTEWETDCEPFPEREIEVGEFVALLATRMLPGELPAVRGEKAASKVADCPGARIKPAETPLTEYRAPETLTFDTVTSEFPAFVRVTLNTPLFPTATFPKFRLEALAVRSAVDAIPVPPRETVLGELEASLAIETLPDKAPAAFGEKTILNVDCFPALITRGSEMPVIVTPAAVVFARVTVRFDSPPFDIVTD
jgi:hypothetical protein